MPIYEYRCSTCDQLFELRRPAAEASAGATCPDGHEGARRMLSRFATVFGSSGQGDDSRAAGGCGAGCAGAAAAARAGVN
jgi:putative FmdB family regulatory protein